MHVSDAPDLQTRLAKALAGQYTIERALGHGGMGTVFLARDESLDREVAIKVIAPEVAASPELRQRFIQEAKTVAKLRHPNIVAVYAAGEADGPPVPLTISIGVHVVAPGERPVPEDVIRAADAALYRAKQEGRDRVTLAEAVVG